MPPVLSDEDLAFWDQNGYVVAKSVISREQAARTAADVWAFRGQDPDDPATWYGEEIGGIMVEMYHSQAQWDNRTAPKVHQAFAEVLGSEELWVTMDRCNFKPPCRSEDDGWARGLPLHWDGPRPDIGTPYVKETSVQGALFLTDCGPGSGGCERTQLPPAPA